MTRVRKSSQPKRPARRKRVLIVDDHELIRRGVRALLRGARDYEVCGEAADGQEALQKALELRPDLVVMDISMPRLSGLEATRELRERLPGAEILIVSQHESAEMMRQAFVAGARGYLLKSAIGDDLFAALGRVARGKTFRGGLAGPPRRGRGTRKALEQPEPQESAGTDKLEPDAKDRLRILAERLPVSVARCNREFRYEWANARFADWVQLPVKAIVGRSMEEVLGGETFRELRPRIERVLGGETLHYEALMELPRAGRRFAESTCSPTTDGSGRVDGWLEVIVDATERRQAKAEREQMASRLRDTATRLEVAFHQAYAFIAFLSLDGTILEVNEGPVEGLGFARSEVLGRKIWEPWWSRLEEETERLKESVERVARGEVVREECRFHDATGQVRTADRTLSPIRDEQGRVILLAATGLDITERKRREDSRAQSTAEELARKETQLQVQAAVLRELSGRLMQAQDEERRRIARELHDGVGQLMAAVGMNIRTVLKEKTRLSRKAAQCLEENSGLVEQALTDIRTMSHLLHPPLLEEVGLVSAMRWYIEGFSNRSNIAVTLKLPQDLIRLAPDSELALFRIVQEALTNVHRHSGSATAMVQLELEGERIRLEVRDFGAGIPADRQKELLEGQAVGIGLRGMQERMKQLRGELLMSSDENGTAITAILPVAVRQPSRELLEPPAKRSAAAAGQR